MSTTLDLTLVEKELVMPGVRFTHTGLRWDGEPTERTVANVATALHTMRSVMDWAEADYLPQMVRVQLGRSARKPKKDADSEQMEMRVVSEFAALNGRDAAQLHERDKVGRFFPESMRRPELGFQHHAEAWVASNGDKAKAAEWLDVAVNEHMTVAELRAHIRRQARVASEGEAAQGDDNKAPMPDPDVAHMDLAAARLRAQVRRFGAEDAKRELRGMCNVVALVDELRKRANG